MSSFLSFFFQISEIHASSAKVRMANSIHCTASDLMKAGNC